MGLRANCMTCMQLCAVSQERWNALPPSQRGSWEAWKNEWLETWQHLLWFHIPGNFDLQQRNQNKKSPSCWEACTTGRWGCGGEVGAGWNNEASHVDSIWVTLAQLKAFVMVKVRGNSNALQGCQKLVGFSGWCTEKQPPPQGRCGEEQSPAAEKNCPRCGLASSNTRHQHVCVELWMDDTTSRKTVSHQIIVSLWQRNHLGLIVRELITTRTESPEDEKTWKSP